jgi:plasmid maintenance system killer protein
MLDTQATLVYPIVRMIRSFQHKGLAKLWNEGDKKAVRPDLLDRVRRRLTALDEAQDLRELNLPGWGFHPLQGRPPATHSRSTARVAYHL